MNLLQFINKASQRTIERGRDYYDDDRVGKIQNISPYLFRTKVQGYHKYNVEIEIRNDRVISAECDCPYDDESVCKHIVAVCLKLIDKKKEEQPNLNTETNVQEPGRISVDLLESLPKSSLVSFLKSLFLKSPEYEIMFMSMFSDHLQDNAEEKYRKLVSSFFESTKNQIIILNALEDLFKKAESVLNQGNPGEAWIICKTIFDQLSEIQTKDNEDNEDDWVDDEDDEWDDEDDEDEWDDDEDDWDNKDENDLYLPERLSEPFINLLEKIHIQADEVLKKDIFNWLIINLNRHYHSFNDKKTILSIFSNCCTDQDSIDQLIDYLTAKIECSYFYEKEILIKTTYDLLMKSNKVNKAQRLLESHTGHHSIVLLLLNHYIKMKDYFLAEKLGRDQMIESYNQGSIKYYKDISNLVIKIADLISNLSLKQDVLFHLFSHCTLDMEDYRKLKSTYNEEVWNNERVHIIIELKTTLNGSIFNEVLGKIYLEENLWDELLELVKQSSSTIQLIKSYKNVLYEKFPSAVETLYLDTISSHSEKTGRENYEQLTDMIKDLHSLTKNDRQIKEMILNLLEKYKTRNAMKEVLKKPNSNRY